MPKTLEDSHPAMVDPLVMRNTMGAFTTGVGVVTTKHNNEVHGMTINSLTSVSLDPPLLLICLMNDARTKDAIVKRGRFAVSILARNHRHHAKSFSRQGAARSMDGLSETDRGIPYIHEALAWLDCSVYATYPGGDHLIILGLVEDCDTNSGDPLLFSSGSFGELGNYQGALQMLDHFWYRDSSW